MEPIPAFPDRIIILMGLRKYMTKTFHRNFDTDNKVFDV